MAVRNFSVDITVSEREAFKKLAKSRGMTVQGLMAQLVRRELNNAGEIASPYSDSIRNGTPAIGNQVR